MAKSGLKHIDVGAELTKTEWESEDSHELLHGTSFPSSPVERQLFYRDDEHKWYIYNASAWVWLGGGGGGGMAIHGNEYHDPDFASEAALSSHAAAATGVHGVGASTVESVSGSQAKVDSHKDLTTGVHGLSLGARAYHNVNQSIAHDTWAPLAFNSERYDTDTIHDMVTNNSRLTCKTAGRYNIAVTVGFAINAVGMRSVGMRLNGATWIAQARFGASPQYETCIAFSTIYTLAVNDYLEVIAYQNSGGALDVYFLGNQSPEFMMERAG